MSGAGNAIVVGNELFNGALRVNNNETAIVQNNATQNGSVVVNSKQKADVRGNVAANKVRCANNVELQSFANVAKVADECP